MNPTIKLRLVSKQRLSGAPAIARPAHQPCLVPGDARRSRPAPLQFIICLVLLLPSLAARGQLPLSDLDSFNSVSGQFVITRLERSTFPGFRLNLEANTNVVELETAFMAISAERFKTALWRQLGLPANAPWSGKIHLRLHPAASLDDPVTITSTPFLDRWTYGVDLPDRLWKSRYARALSGVLLLEIANRSAGQDGHSAEIPPWLVDGLARQVLATDGEKVVLSAPRKMQNDVLAVTRLNQTERGYDPLASARQILQNAPALTFDQLSWPTGDQMDGADGGLYSASAQLFQSALLGLKNGPAKMRAMLAALPAHLNWQLAFFQAFDGDFQRPADVEKWWALQVVNFVSRAAGPHWTTDISVARLHEVLMVPVESRGASNALPARAEITLQAALQSLPTEQRDLVVRTKVRDLALVELRLAPPFGTLADAYRVALSDFLGETPPAKNAPVTNKHVALKRQASVADTLKKLDALDLRCRNAEARLAASAPARPAGVQR